MLRLVLLTFLLSVFKNFPNATVELEGLKVINNAPFAGDTLAYVGNFSAKVNLKDILFEGIRILTSS